jgi:sulfate permease
MSEIFTGLTIPILLSMFLAINMGASGTASSFSALHGARIIKWVFIPGIFGMMVLLGALIAGKEVSLTLGNGLLDQSHFTPLVTSIILLSISLSLLMANLFGIPQSTSQATVLSLAGAATVLEGISSNHPIFEIMISWLILPLVAFFIMLFISKWFIPFLKNIIDLKDYSQLKTHIGFKIILVVSSMYVAFSIGANNVANAAAPIASLTANKIGTDAIQNLLPIIILSVFVVAPCFSIGSYLLGHKVTEKTGMEIVTVDTFQATLIALIVATLVVLASVVKGIPTSLVQLNGAAFIALSITKNGFRNTFKNKTVLQFFVMWSVAPMIAYGLTYFLILLFV